MWQGGKRCVLQLFHFQASDEGTWVVEKIFTFDVDASFRLFFYLQVLGLSWGTAKWSTFQSCPIRGLGQFGRYCNCCCIQSPFSSACPGRPWLRRSHLSWLPCLCCHHWLHRKLVNLQPDHIMYTYYHHAQHHAGRPGQVYPEGGTVDVDLEGRGKKSEPRDGILDRSINYRWVKN